MTARLRELVSELAGADDEGRARALVGNGGSGLTEALDALADRLGDEGRAVVRIRGRLLDADRSMAALAPLLDGAAADPSVDLSDHVDADATVLVDDAQWLDAGSARALAAWADAPATGGRRLVMACRPAPRSPEVTELCTTVDRHAAPVRLGPLTPAEARERLAARLEAPVADDLLDLALTGSGGVPLLLDGLVDGWRAVGAVERGALTTAAPTLPDGLVERLRPRIEGLAERERRLLEVWSFPTALADEDAAAVAGFPTEELGATAHGLRAAGMLLEGHDEPVPAVAAAVTALLADADTRRLHRAIATALQGRGAAPARVADHLVAADGGDLGPDERRTVLEAARSLLATDPALALEWLAHLPDDDGTVAACRARAAAAVGALDEALAAADSALVTGDEGARAEALGVEATVFAARGLWRRSADAALGVTGHPDHPDGHWRLSAVVPLVAAGRLDEARVALEEGGATVTRPAPIATEVALLCARAVLDGCGEDPAALLRPLTEAMELVESAEGLSVPEPPHTLLAALAPAFGEDEAARAALRRWSSGPGASGRGADQDRVTLLGGWAALRAGRWRDAEAALEAVDVDGLPTRSATLATAIRAGMARRTGDVAGLMADWDGTFAALTRAPDDLLAVEPLCELVLVAARLGHGDVAGERLDRLRRLVREMDDPPLFAVPVRWTTVLAAVAAEQPETVAAAAAELEAAPVPSRLAGVVDGARAWAAVLAGTVDDDDLATATEGLVDVGLAWEASRLVGQAAVRAEDQARTRRLLELARTLKSRLPGEADEPVGEPSAAADLLSEREAEVAELVSAGLTHKEIGAQLYISPKTVEHHVARIRRKLGVRTRAEMLAALRAGTGDGGE